MSAVFVQGANAQVSGLPVRPPNLTCLAPDRPPSGASVNIALDPMFNGKHFVSATSMVQSPTNPNRWYLTLKGEPHRPDDIGLLFTVLDNPGSAPTVTTLLDLSDIVEINSEAGVFSIALHPDFATNGYAYVSFTGGPTVPDTELTMYVNRYTSLDGGLTLDRSTEQNLLTIPQPDSHHQGGSVAFGPRRIPLRQPRRKEATRRGAHRTRVTSWVASSDWTSMAGRPTRSLATIHLRRGAGPRSSSHGGCGTRGAFTSTGTPASCGSVTSDTTSVKSSMWS